MNGDAGELAPLLKRLNLANARRVYPELIRRAEEQQWSYGEFLRVLVSEEIAHRYQTRMQRLTRRAGFPFLKTVEEFDFTYQSTVRLQLLGSALCADFVTEGRTLVFIGKPGRGKTHLAVGIAYRATQHGFEVLFVTAAAMIDELGYLTYGTDAANMLFHVVNDRYLHRRSMIFTTNKSMSQWGLVLHDHDLAAAIVDRILERGRLLHLDGPSIRSRHVDLDQDVPSALSTKEPDRISGINRRDFPEPTPRVVLTRGSSPEYPNKMSRVFFGEAFLQSSEACCRALHVVRSQSTSPDHDGASHVTVQSALTPDRSVGPDPSLPPA